MTDKEDKRVLFWLHRALLEKCEDLKRITGDISLLNFHAEHYTTMRPTVRAEIRANLIATMDAYDWKDGSEDPPVASSKEIADIVEDETDLEWHERENTRRD